MSTYRRDVQEMPVFLAVRELRFGRTRFALMGSVVALIAVLMVLLSGLSVGLVNDGVSGLKKLPVTSFAFGAGTQKDAAFTRSVVDTTAADTWRARPGVADATPFGNTLVNGRSNRGTAIDLALFGVEPDSFLAPRPADGVGLGSKENGIVVKIGRASCRERVEVWVVAVALKKNAR